MSKTKKIVGDKIFTPSGRLLSIGVQQLFDEGWVPCII